MKSDIEILNLIHDDLLNQKYAQELNRRVFSQKALATKDDATLKKFQEVIAKCEMTIADINKGLAVCEQLIVEAESKKSKVAKS